MLNDSFNFKAVEKKLKTTYTYLNAWICDVVFQLNDEFYTIQTKCFWIAHGILDFPKCQNPNCNVTFNNHNVRTFFKGYPNHCCHKCAVNDPVVKEHAKNTCLDRYGTVSPAQNEDVKAKSKATCLKNYGVEYSFQSENNKQKSRQTWLINYGVDHPSKSKQVVEKTEGTKHRKYGEKQPWHSAESIEKRKLTWIENYGVDHPIKSNAIQQRMRNTTKENYGVEHYSQSDDFRYSRAKLSYEKILLTNEYDEPMFSLDDYFNDINHNSYLDFKCKKCNKIFKAIHHNGSHQRCPYCYPVDRMWSIEEKDIADFIKSIYAYPIVENTKAIISPRELDIYVPDKNLAFEFDGLYWHNDSNKPKEYHLEKTKQCESKNIQLIHIFENEWIFKTNIVKSRIANLLGVFDNVVFARKCVVKLVDSCESKKFQDENHIQGSINAKVHLGLYFNDELISLMTFGKSRFSKKYEWEPLRFCNKCGYHIPGAAGKLLKHFERNYNPKSLVSYADRRWSKGKLYEALGFTFDHASDPNYWYFNGNAHILMSRVQCQKHKLKTMLPKFDEMLSEVENMKMNGYQRIFDCGNIVYVKNY